MIKVYSTPTCPYCVMAKDFLKKKNIPYEDVNVAANHAAAEEMIAKTHQMGVPVIDIEGEFLIGFNKAEVEKTLKEKGLLA